MIRRHVVPRSNGLSGPEQQILTYLRLGCSLWGAAMIADIGLCEALRWLEHGEQYPSGPHSAFGREVRAIEMANRSQFRSQPNSGISLRSKAGLPATGNGSSNGHANGSGGSNGQHLLVRWDD